MKSLIPFILAALTFLTACEPEVKRVEATPEKPQAGEEPAPPKPDPGRIKCPQCAGEKFVMVRSGGVGTDFRQACPICAGKGFRQLTIPANKRLCQDCKGMGVVLDTAKSGGASLGGGKLGAGSSFANKTTCARCTGTGLVIAGPKDAH